MRVRRSLAVAIVAVGLAAGTAHAQGTLGGTLTATLELTSACTISGDNEVAGVNFGVLDFGAHPATFTGVITASAAGGAGFGGPTQILCSPDIENLTIAVGPGENAGEGSAIGTGSRALASAASDYVPYDVYVDASFATPYPTAGSEPFAIPVVGQPFALPIFGRINKTSADALPAGTYSDSLVVTITF